MTVFNAFMCVIRRNLVTIIIFTAITVGFSLINFASGDSAAAFTAENPGVICIDLDNTELSKSLVSYLDETTSLHDSSGSDRDDDALFYREVCCIITIPKGYSENISSSSDGGIEIRTTGDSRYTLVEMSLARYMRVQYYYTGQGLRGEALAKAVGESVADNVEVIMKAPKDSTALSKAATYFSFASYSITACILFIICLVLTSFNDRNIFRRTAVSSMNYNKFSLMLMFCCGMYALAVWFAFTVLGVVLCGSALLSVKGLLFAAGSLVFTICILCLSFLLSGVLHSRNAVTGIVNVIALGSAFLCGAFIPTSMLPDAVLAFAHVLPAYWFIKGENEIAAIESLSLQNLTGVLVCFGVMLCFALVFAVSGLAIASHNRRRE